MQEKTIIINGIAVEESDVIASARLLRNASMNKTNPAEKAAAKRMYKTLYNILNNSKIEKLLERAYKLAESFSENQELEIGINEETDCYDIRKYIPDYGAEHLEDFCKTNEIDRHILKNILSKKDIYYCI